MNCEECRHYPEAGEPCPVNICPDEGEAWPLPKLVVSTGAIYAAKPTTGDGAIWPDIRIALMDREEANTVPSERDSYAHQIVTRCNAHDELTKAVRNLLDDIDALKRRDDLQNAVESSRSWFSVIRALDLLDNIRDAK